MSSLAPPARARKHLERGHLSFRDQLVIAVTSVAPAYSIALTIAALAATVGLLSPIAVIIGFIPNFGMAVAYYLLNREDPNCGTSYAWIGTSFGRTAGFLAAWVAVVQAVIALAFATPFAGQVTIDFLQRIHVGFGLSPTDLTATTIIGVLWMIVVTLIVVRGIRLTAHVQYFLLGGEFLVVLLLSVVGILKGNVSGIHGGWFNPFGFTGVSAVAAGMVVSVFLYAGWNTGPSLNEETEDQREAPGRAALIGLVILLGTFLLAAISIQMTISPKALEASGTNALVLWAQTVFGKSFAPIAVLALLSSTLAVLQTTLLPTARFTFSMSRDGVIADWWSSTSKRFGTPWASSVALTGIVCVIAVLNLYLKDLNSIVLAGVIASGVLLSFFYAATAFACAYRFRSGARHSVRIFTLAIVVPLASAAILLYLAIYLLHSDWNSVSSFKFDGANGRFQVAFVGAVLIAGLVAAAILRLTRWRRLTSAPAARQSAPREVSAAEQKEEALT
jgi:amino acid transporter